MSIEELKEKVRELEVKHTNWDNKLSVDEVKDVFEQMSEAHKELFRAHYARAKGAVDNEKIMLEYMEFLTYNDFYMLDQWHPLGKTSMGIYKMCEELKSSARSSELRDAAQCVFKYMKYTLDNYNEDDDEKTYGPNPDME